MLRVRSKIVKTLMVVMAVGLLPASPAVGQSAPAPAASGFTVTPPLAELEAGPGEKITKTFEVSAEGTSPVNVSTEIRNFSAGGTGGQPDFTNDETGYSLKQWMKISPETATLQPGTPTQFTLTISVPSGTGGGGRYGAISFHPSTISKEGNVHIDQAVTSLVLLKVRGAVSENMSITTFATRDAAATDQKNATVFSGGPIRFVLEAKNDGNIQEQPKVTVTVKNAFGGKATSSSVASPGYTLPGSQRTYLIPWAKKSLIGHYTATVQLTYGQNNTVLTAKTSFWAIPIWLRALPVVLVVVLVGVFLVSRTKRKRRKASLTSSGTQHDTMAPQQAAPRPPSSEPPPPQSFS